VTSVDAMFSSADTAVLNREVDDSDREWFRQQLSTVNRFTGFAWFMSPEPEQQTPMPVTTVNDAMMQPGKFLICGDNCTFISVHVSSGIEIMCSAGEGSVEGCPSPAD